MSPWDIQCPSPGLLGNIQTAAPDDVWCTGLLPQATESSENMMEIGTLVVAQQVSLYKSPGFSERPALFNTETTRKKQLLHFWVFQSPWGPVGELLPFLKVVQGINSVIQFLC